MKKIILTILIILIPATAQAENPTYVVNQTPSCYPEEATFTQDEKHRLFKTGTQVIGWYYELRNANPQYAWDFRVQANPWGGSNHWAYYNFHNRTPEPDIVYHGYWSVNQACVIPYDQLDTDGDGLADKFDPFPNEDVEFTAQELINCHDENGVKTFIKYKIVATNGVTTYLNHGTCPQSNAISILPNNNTPLSFQEFKDIYSEDTSDAALKALADASAQRIETASLGSGTTIEAQPENPTMETGTTVDGTSTDREVSEATANNTDKIVKNQEKISGQLGTGNEYLRESVKNGAEQTGHLQDINQGLKELGQKLDNLEITVEQEEPESSGPYTGTTLEGQDGYSNETKLEEVKTRFQDRYQGFINNVKSSDLFTVPFSFFNGLPTSTTSDLTINIGKWGGDTEGTSTFDLNDFDNIWSVLAAVLLVLTSWTCIRIILLKKG